MLLVDWKVQSLEPSIDTNTSAAISKTFMGKPKNTVTVSSLVATSQATYKSIFGKPSSSELVVESEERVFIHLNFHPFEPNRQSIQALAQTTLLTQKKKTLENVANGFGGCVGVKRLVVAYHRTWNIKDYLIPRNSALDLVQVYPHMLHRVDCKQISIRTTCKFVQYHCCKYVWIHFYLYRPPLHPGTMPSASWAACNLFDYLD